MAGMSCHEVLEHLSDYIDGELTAPLESRVSDHLSACESCREEARVLRALVSASSTLGSRTIPRDITAGVMARITASRARTPWWQRVLKPVVAVPVGVAAIGLTVLTLLPPRAPSIPERMGASAVDRKIPMAKDYAIFRSEQAFAGGEGVLIFAEMSTETGNQTTR
jgi:anti-sigma factor RsiW